MMRESHHIDQLRIAAEDFLILRLGYVSDPLLGKYRRCLHLSLRRQR